MNFSLKYHFVCSDSDQPWCAPAPPRAAARGDRLRKAKTRGFSDRQIAQLVTAPDAGRIFNGDGETSGTWGVHQPEYKIFHGIHMENPLEKPYWKWWFNGD